MTSNFFSTGSAIAIVGRIAYCRKIDAHLSQYDIGIEFISLKDGDKERLQHFLGTLEKDE